MNKSKKLNKNKNKTRKNKFGGKNCVQKCKNKFFKIVKKSPKLNKYKTFFSYLGIKGKKYDEIIDREVNKVLDDKQTTDDPVFKMCVNECEKPGKSKKIF
jgi:hypothetical protein